MSAMIDCVGCPRSRGSASSPQNKSAILSGCRYNGLDGQNHHAHRHVRVAANVSPSSRNTWSCSIRDRGLALSCSVDEYQKRVGERESETYKTVQLVEYIEGKYVVLFIARDRCCLVGQECRLALRQLHDSN
jgi:hypothetical protein